MLDIFLLSYSFHKPWAVNEQLNCSSSKQWSFCEENKNLEAMPRSFSLHTVHRLTTLCCLLFIKFHVRVRSLFWRQNGAAALLSRPRNRSFLPSTARPARLRVKKTFEISSGGIHSYIAARHRCTTSLHDIAAARMILWLVVLLLTFSPKKRPTNSKQPIKPFWERNPSAITGQIWQIRLINQLVDYQVTWCLCS